MIDDRSHEADRALERDLQTYKTSTDRDLPDIDTTARVLRDHAEGLRAIHEESMTMKIRRFVTRRPALAVAGALAVVAVVLGVVPVSYERTTGHDVTLTLEAPRGDAAFVSTVADRFGALLGADDLRVSRAAPDGDAIVLRASVPSRRGAEIERKADAFAAALGEKGIAATVSVTPVKERISSSLYAYAMQTVIELRVDVAGRTAEEIEADVRAQLEAAGIENPDVQVSRDGDRTEVRIQADDEVEGQDRDRQFNLTMKGSDTLNARLHEFRVERRPGMTDADVKAEIERQMREAGVEGEVTVENGRVEIQAHKEQSH